MFKIIVDTTANSRTELNQKLKEIAGVCKFYANQNMPEFCDDGTAHCTEGTVSITGNKPQKTCPACGLQIEASQITSTNAAGRLTHQNCAGG